MSVSIQQTEFMVTALPVDHPSNRYVALWVKWRGTKDGLVDRYVVTRDRNATPEEVWRVDTEEWVMECSDDRDDPEHLANTRFPLHMAQMHAIQLAPTMTVNGFTVEDILARGMR